MKEDNDIMKQGTDAVSQLFRVFQQISDKSAKNCIQSMPEQVVQLSNQLNQVKTGQQQSLYDLKSVKQQLDNMVSTNKLLENASQTNQLLGKEHYDEHVIQPIVRSLFPVLDIIADAQKHWSSSEQIIELLNVIWSQMEQFLFIYDVDIIKHSTNDKFNPQIMKPVTRTPTNDKRLDDCVSESLQVGFQFGKTRMLRLEAVSLYEYQPSQTNTINLNERVEK